MRCAEQESYKCANNMKESRNDGDEAAAQIHLTRQPENAIRASPNFDRVTENLVCVEGAARSRDDKISISLSIQAECVRCIDGKGYGCANDVGESCERGERYSWGRCCYATAVEGDLWIE